MEQQILQRYEPEIGKISRFYYGLYKGTGDFDLEDLEQAGRITILNLSRKRPEKIDNLKYVRASIKYAIFGEMKKMRHRAKNIYLPREEGDVQLVDVLPTNERGTKRLDETEELLYRVKHEFSEKDAEGLEALLEKCDNIYDLNLTDSLSTDTKDRVRVVTKMDLNDEEMQVYAEVLTGARKYFPKGYLHDQGSRQRAVKYLSYLLSVSGMKPVDFAQSHDKYKFLKRYRLNTFYQITYHNTMLDFLRELDQNIRKEDMWVHQQLDISQIKEIIEARARFKSAKEASRRIHYRQDTILKYWKANGFEVKNNPPLTIGQISQITIAYALCGNISEVKRQLGYSYVTILKHLRQSRVKSNSDRLRVPLTSSSEV